MQLRIAHSTSVQNILRSEAAAVMAACEIHSQCNFVKLFSPSFPHILEKIFFSLDYESYKNCLEVNSEWKGVLTSERYKTKGRTVFTKEIVEDERKLHWAAMTGRRDDVRLLLASGMVNVNCKDSVLYCRTPLHLAVMSGDKEVAKLLIDSSAGVNLADEYGQTPLHWAADKGNSEVAKLLIECGADPNVCTKNGSTPLHMAAYYGDKDLALLLVDGKEELAKILIDSGADTNVADEDGQTPPHIAAKKGYKEVVKLLIKEGADMDKADNNGKTPRHQMDWLEFCRSSCN